MRSKGPSERTGAAALGALVFKLAVKAGYDLTPGGTGRTKLAEDTGMSIWSVGRMFRGETLPKVENVYALADVLDVDENKLLDTAGYRHRPVHTKNSPRPLLSVTQTLSPEAVADSLGITHPFVRKMLTSSIEEAIRLQREADEADADSEGEAGNEALAK